MNGNHEIFRHSRDPHVEHEREHLRRLYTRIPENPDIPFYQVKPAPIHHIFKPNKIIDALVSVSFATTTLFELGISPTLGFINGAAGMIWFGFWFNRDVNHIPGERHSRIANFLLYDARGEVADGIDRIRGAVARHISAQKK